MTPSEFACLAGMLTVGIICIAVLLHQRAYLAHSRARFITDDDKAAIRREVSANFEGQRERFEKLESALKEQFNNHANELVRINNKIGR